MAKIADIRKGFTYRENGEIWTIIDFQNVQVGRGAGFCRVKKRSLGSGKTVEDKYGTSDNFTEVRVERREYQYSYKEGDQLVLMNTEDFNTINLNAAAIEGLEFLTEGDNVEVLVDTDGDIPLTVDIPTTVDRVVTYTEPGLAGDTATRTLKPATIEGGAEVRVPLFVNIGDKIRVNTESREYVERVK